MTGAPSARLPVRALAVVALPLVVACTGPQHALDPRGPGAARIADLWWVMFALASAVSVAVVVLLVVAVRRSTARRERRPTGDVDGTTLVWTAGVIIPALILGGVLALSFRVSTEVYPRAGDDGGALIIEVIGHQYWWEVRYPEHEVTTANEIHLPAGTPVIFRLTAPDVIHSFWIPQIHGKIDMIPGQVNELRVRVDEPGRFRGQCAEFCGEGHALMALWVTALEPRAFPGWIESRRAGAAREAFREPEAGTQAARGREIFFEAGCGDCHSTRGAPLPPGVGQPAPDLSDLAARATLAAGTLPNTTEARRRWIRDPSTVKPGALMPATDLPRPEMEALLAYLETLR